jgi:hypothetical protein
VSLLIVALAAGLGWAASFVGLHDYGVRQLYGFTDITAWFIPGAIDGAAFATSLMTYRANIKGRAAIRGRLLMWAFTAASGWINWIHQINPEARFVAAGLPVAAVAVFDVVLIELRADFEERHGRRAFRLRPGLLMLRYAVDKRGTREAFRRQIEAIPVASLAGLGNDLLHDASRGGRVVPRTWLDLPQAKGPFSTQEPVTEVPALPFSQPPRELAVNEWMELPQAAIGTAPLRELESARQDRAPAAEPEPPIAVEPTATSEQPAKAGTEVVSEPVPEPSASGEEDQSKSGAASDNETTAKLPIVRNDPYADEREAARELVRENPSEWTGKSLGDRFGKSASWGRSQIKAVRDEEQERRRPKLVAVDR